MRSSLTRKTREAWSIAKPLGRREDGQEDGLVALMERPDCPAVVGYADDSGRRSTRVGA